MNKETFNELKAKFNETKFKKNTSKLITLLSYKINLDRTRAKLLLVILILMFISFWDILWIVVPIRLDHESYQKQPYKMEEVPGLINKYQTILLEKPGDYRAHYELGKIYVFLKEYEKAKVEFFQSIEASPTNNFNASFALTDLYIKEKNPGMAEEIIMGIDEKRLFRQELLIKAGFLADISRLYFGMNDLGSTYRMLKESTNYYTRLDEKEKLDASRKELAYLLVDMADDAYYNQNDPVKASIYLDESQKIEENAWAYAKLGYLFFEDPKLSTEYFEKAYNFEPTAINSEVLIATLQEAIKICLKEGREGDRTYYKSVLDRVKDGSFHEKFYTKIALNNVEGFYERQENKDLFLPVVYININNLETKKSLDYIKVRAIFIDNDNKIVGHHDVIAINSAKPLLAGGHINTIRIESNRFLTSTDKPNTVYKVILYISKKRPDEWAYATTKILRNY